MRQTEFFRKAWDSKTLTVGLLMQDAVTDAPVAPTSRLLRKAHEVIGGRDPKKQLPECASPCDVCRTSEPVGGPIMATNGLDEVGSVVNTSEAHPSRREILVHGSKVAARMGIATLLGNFGVFLGKSYRMDRCASGDPSLHKAALAMTGVEGGIFGEVATTAEVVERFTCLHRKPPPVKS